MKNLFKEFVLAAPVKNRLVFGHNENVVIENIDFSIRTKNGIATSNNTFIRLTKIDPTDDNKLLASSEINFFNLDPTKDYVQNNFMKQFTVEYAILEALGLDAEGFEEEVMELFQENLDDILVAKFLKNATNTKAVQYMLQTAFKSRIEGNIGLTSKLLKCKILVNKSCWTETGDELNWILPMDSEESLPAMTSYERSVYKKSLTAESKKGKPDAVGNAPAIILACIT